MQITEKQTNFLLHLYLVSHQIAVRFTRDSKICITDIISIYHLYNELSQQVFCLMFTECVSPTPLMALRWFMTLLISLTTVLATSDFISSTTLTLKGELFVKGLTDHELNKIGENFSS